MFHYHYVGHFDPRDPVDFSVRPARPRVGRPLARAAVERVLAGFPPGVAEYVDYEDPGYVVCRWSHAPGRLWEDVSRFALALAAAEGAVVMNEAPMFEIEFPPAAREEQRRRWADQGI